MLLKNCLTPEPPDGFLDSFWPSISPRLQSAEDGPSGGAPSGTAGSTSREAIVFKSSAAMQILSIPEPRALARPSAPAATDASPTAPPPAAPSAWRWPMALIVSTAIAVVGFLIYQNQQNQQQPLTVASAPAGATQDELRAAEPPTEPSDQPSAAPLAPSEPAPSEATPETPSAGPEGAPEPASEAAPGDREAVGPTSARKAARPKREGEKAETKTAAAPSEPARAEPPASKPAAASPPPSKGGDLLDTLIDDALGKDPKDDKPKAKKEATPAPMPGGSDLPDQLSFNQVRQGMSKVNGLVGSCYDKYQVEGTASVKVVIKNDGTPSDVQIKGKFFGTDTGTCVVDAVKKATFAKFSGKPMTIQYTFQLQ